MKMKTPQRMKICSWEMERDLVGRPQAVVAVPRAEAKVAVVLRVEARAPLLEPRKMVLAALVGLAVLEALVVPAKLVVLAATGGAGRTGGAGGTGGTGRTGGTGGRRAGKRGRDDDNDDDDPNKRRKTGEGGKLPRQQDGP